MRSLPAESSLRRAESFGGTSTTLSPAATRCWATGRPIPPEPSTAQRRFSKRLPHRSSERKPALLVEKTASSRSLPPSSMTATALVTLWGSIPMSTSMLLKPPSRAPDNNLRAEGTPTSGRSHASVEPPRTEREPAGAGQKGEPAPGKEGGAGALGATRPAPEEPCCGRSKVPAHIKQVGCPCADDCRCYAGGGGGRGGGPPR